MVDDGPEVKEAITKSSNDNVKARKINGKIQNEFKKSSGKPYRSQWEIHEYFKALLEE